VPRMIPSRPPLVTSGSSQPPRFPTSRGFRHPHFPASGGLLRRSFLSFLLFSGFHIALSCAKPTGEVQRVHVPPGASFSQVTDTLSTRGIIDFAPVFKLYAQVRRDAHVAKPGTYGFRKGESWNKVLRDLSEGNTLHARFVIPEGWNLDRIAARIGRFMEKDSLEVLDMLDDTSFTKRFKVPGPTLEGYLYPATYEFPVDIALDSMVAQLVARYQQVWTDARRARADSIDMTERQVVTLASIVETEAKQRSEMPRIASVYHNRLKIGMKLDADPTVQYALGRRRRARLFYNDINRVANNPYNTYHIRGLPPGPIASPSDAAIDAVLTPDTTKFLFFVARPDGTHIFTRSLLEHNRAKRVAAAARQAAARDTAAR
jgi:peptidoglycan lytic transglycosylase G